MAKAGGLGEDEGGEPRIGGLRCGGKMEWQAQEYGEGEKKRIAAGQHFAKRLVDSVRRGSFFSSRQKRGGGEKPEVEKARHHRNRGRGYPPFFRVLWMGGKETDG